MTDRVSDLRSAVLLSVGGGDRALSTWVERHHGSPSSLDRTTLRGVVEDFDHLLQQSESEGVEFTAAVSRLRLIFAKHARLADSAPSASRPRRASQPSVRAVGTDDLVLPRAARQPLVTDEGPSTHVTFDANEVLVEALTRMLEDDLRHTRPA